MRSSGADLALREPPTRPSGAEPAARRLTLVITTLAAGGAERVLSTLANYWAAQGREVTLITLDAAANDFFPLHPGIRRVALELISTSRRPREAIWSNLRRVWALRRAVRASRPEVVISFTNVTNVLTLLATRGLPVPVIVSERVDPERHPLPRSWSALRRRLYPFANALVVQTERARRWATRFLPAQAVHRIENPVVPAAAPVQGAAAGAGRLVLAIGRLDPQKGFDLLLRAFARCRPHHPDWSLLIVGEGPERAPLEALAARLGIAAAVEMPGRIAQLEPLLRRADLFVLSSRYEGFPNALLEAMAAGVAVITTDCPSGPSEIVRDGMDGLLVPVEDVDALAAAMQRLMGDPEERRRLGAGAVEVRERFALEAIMERWEALIADVVALSGRG